MLVIGCNFAVDVVANTHVRLYVTDNRYLSACPLLYSITLQLDYRSP